MSLVLGLDVSTRATKTVILDETALLAVGLGWFESIEEACRDLVNLDDVIDPSPETDSYGDAYARYRELYPALAPTFHSLP